MSIFKKFAELIVEVTLPDPEPLYEERKAKRVVNHIERQGVKVINLR